jgi:phosphoglycerate dehydrogenase-like enzyme
MEESKEFIAKADVIFLHAPGLNKTLFLSNQKSL